MGNGKNVANRSHNKLQMMQAPPSTPTTTVPPSFFEGKAKEKLGKFLQDVPHTKYTLRGTWQRGDGEVDVENNPALARMNVSLAVVSSKQDGEERFQWLNASVIPVVAAKQDDVLEFINRVSTCESIVKKRVQRFSLTNISSPVAALVSPGKSAAVQAFMAATASATKSGTKTGLVYRMQESEKRAQDAESRVVELGKKTSEVRNELENLKLDHEAVLYETGRRCAELQRLVDNAISNHVEDMARAEKLRAQRLKEYKDALKRMDDENQFKLHELEIHLSNERDVRQDLEEQIRRARLDTEDLKFGIQELQCENRILRRELEDVRKARSAEISKRQQAYSIAKNLHKKATWFQLSATKGKSDRVESLLEALEKSQKKYIFFGVRNQKRSMKLARQEFDMLRLQIEQEFECAQEFKKEFPEDDEDAESTQLENLENFEAAVEKSFMDKTMQDCNQTFVD